MKTDEEEKEPPSKSDVSDKEENEGTEHNKSHGRVRARPKSKFMIGVIEKEGPWLSLELFLSFNKIKTLISEFFHTDEPQAQLNHLRTALTKIQSSTLEIAPDGDKIRRKSSFKGPKPDEEARTIYVENIPSHSTQESLQQIFQEYGPVEYVSLPKYTESHLPKGFAFVEFQTVESAQKALEAYGFISEDFESKNPEELQSIKSFQAEQRATLLKEEIDNSSSQGEGEKTSSSTNASSPTGKNKKKRKRKRKENMECEEDLQLMTLSVMSKTSWRKLRNKYLNLQRKNASLAKQKFREMNKPERVHPKRAVQKEDEEQEEEGKEDSVEKSSSIPFVPNIIVKCVVEEMVHDPKVYKKTNTGWTHEARPICGC
ncbi:LARP7 [Lepeophtheirus salmonis]|uniref:LARP7 n=1 Tax=Lepeophtheirus salmonis TaxID=72036 RepID=A0A7R8H1U7_LEPSM|nr:LARP7 [Lepeophtheirus salmonis]CAF2801355.1 LARP7 [Lepeophtheirus salmonis]